MNTTEMKQNDQIKIHQAGIQQANYQIHWMAHVVYSDVMVCLRSPWLSYEEMIQEIRSNGEKASYQNDKIYWQLVSRQTSVNIPVSKLTPPVYIMLLPISKDGICIPPNEEKCKNIQKSVPGQITYKKKTLNDGLFGLFDLDITEEFVFLNEFPVTGDMILAEYEIDKQYYPITADMIRESIQVTHKKGLKCELRIAQGMENIYRLNENGN